MQPLQPANTNKSVFTNQSSKGNHEHHNWAESLVYKPKDNYSSIKKKVLAGKKDNTTDYVKARVMYYLKNAAYKYNISKSKIATEENVNILIQHLRVNKDLSNADNIKWANWAEGIFQQIESGAMELMHSVKYWQNEMSSNGNKCSILSIKLSGSDLHGKGLGAAFVVFDKKKGEGNIFKQSDRVKVVIKPEDRSLEKSLLGNDTNSFGNWVNEEANLNNDSGIRLITMETHQVHGSIIEFISGVQSQDAYKIHGHGQKSPFEKSMIETIVFAFLTGLADINKENVIWTSDNHPYMIDVDNALNHRQLNQPSKQNGWQYYNMYQTEETIKGLNNNDKKATDSSIYDLAHADPDLFFGKLKDAFRGQKGRAVPIATQTWAKSINDYIVMEHEDKDDFFDKIANRLPEGFGDAKGLKSETGVGSGNGSFDLDKEKEQLSVDFEKGQIPFYTYEYSTGYVYHNGVKIWHGQTLDDAITKLRQKLGV